jgi:hypothetical protein
LFAQQLDFLGKERELGPWGGGDGFFLHILDGELLILSTYGACWVDVPLMQ